MNKTIESELNANSEYNQYCPNCNENMDYDARYLKHLCKKCIELVSDKNGRKVEFFNTEYLGYGCQGYYVGTKQQELYNSVTVYINDKVFTVEDAYFGGIVFLESCL